MEDTIRHNIVQMASPSKPSFLPFFPSDDHMRQASTSLKLTLKMTQKTKDTNTKWEGNKTKIYLPYTVSQSQLKGRVDYDT